MFYAVSARGGAKRLPAAAAAALLRSATLQLRPGGPTAALQTTRALTLPQSRPCSSQRRRDEAWSSSRTQGGRGGGGGRARRNSREDDHSERERRYPRGGANDPATRVRKQRAHENSRAPRFQPFGRAGGEGGKVAEGLYEEFGMHSVREYSAETADERQVLLKRLGGEVKMRASAVAEMVEQEPRLAEQSPEAISERLAWLKERLQLGEEQVRSLVHRRPSVLCRDVEGGMEPKVRWLQEELRLSDDEVASMVTSAPNILSVSVERGMAPKLAWLSDRLRLSHEELAMVVMTCPQLLTSSVEGALEPRLKWLQENLQIGGTVLRERVLSFPWLLNLSEEGKLAPTYEFLKTDLLLDDVEIRKTLFRNPRMFLVPLRPALASTKKWLCQSLAMEECDADAVLTRDARLLLRSTEVLDSKLAFFCQEMGATLEELREVLLTSPNLLLVSVELALAPRVAALKRAGVDVSFSLHWNAVAFGPRGDVFHDWVDKQARRSSR